MFYTLVCLIFWKIWYDESPVRWFFLQNRLFNNYKLNIILCFLEEKPEKNEHFFSIYRERIKIWYKYSGKVNILFKDNFRPLLLMPFFYFIQNSLLIILLSEFMKLRSVHIIKEMPVLCPSHTVGVWIFMYVYNVYAYVGGLHEWLMFLYHLTNTQIHTQFDWV